MSGLSRRRFIGGAAAGAVAVTAVAVPGLAAAVPADDPDYADDDVALDETVVARVRDLRTGEIALYVGTREITHTDRTLARRLARAAAR